MIISLPFGGAAGSTLLDSITYRAAYVACAPSVMADLENPELASHAEVKAEVMDYDGEWDFPLVPHIIGLRSVAVAKDADADAMSIAATSGDHPDMDAFAELASPAAVTASDADADAAAELASSSKDSPTEDQIAAHWVVAEPLGEWAAKYLWAACSGAFVGHKQLFPVNDTPKDLPKRIQVVLQRALLTPTAVLVAIYYARRLPGTFNLNTLPGSLESAFSLDLYRGGLEMGVFKLFCVGAMLANKTLDDNTYTNKAWRDMAELSLFELNSFEMQALGIFSYRLNIQPTEWSDFANGVLAYHATHLKPASSPPLSPIGAALVPTPHSIVLGAFKEITNAVAQPTHAFDTLSSSSPTHAGSPPIPFFFGQEEAKAVKARFYAKEEEIENFDLDADGPLKDEYVPGRMRSRSEAAAAAIEKERSVESAERGLPKPAKWSPADDPVVERQGGSNGKAHRGSYVAPALAGPQQPPAADMSNSQAGPVMAMDVFAMTLQAGPPRSSISNAPPHPFGESPEGHRYAPTSSYGYGPRPAAPPPCPPRQLQHKAPQFYQPAPSGYAFGAYGPPCSAPPPPPAFWDRQAAVFDHRAPPPQLMGPPAFHPQQMARRATVPSIIPIPHQHQVVHYPREAAMCIPQLHQHYLQQQLPLQHQPLHHRLAPSFHPNHPSAFAFGPSLIRA